MAITSGISISFRSQIMLGEHDLDTDSIKLALYSSSASLSDGTTVYTTSNEVVGTGYSAGGVVLTGIDVTTDSSVAVVSITDAVVTASTITAASELDDSRIVSRDSRVPAAVYVPRPTSHSSADWLTMA